MLLSALSFSIRSAQADLFTDAERASLVAYWNAPGRYAIGARADAAKSGPWVARLTPEASTWLHAYNRAIKGLKSGAADRPDLTAAQKAAWAQWVDTKATFDEYSAQVAADAANAQSGAGLPPAVSKAPPMPGAIPDDLLTALDNPPPFAATVAPRRYSVTFDDGQVITYTDQVKMSARSPYFRFAQGVMFSGVALRNVPDAELNALFVDAGMTPFEQHVAKAVSRLEGGFESVNTYDTGYLSVGFIQFATLSGGAGSLGTVLKQQKAARPQEFQNDFRAYGVDVNRGGEVVVIDPATGAELVGAAAVLKIIDDKRLTAVFQRAGQRSRAFRVAQVQVAKSRYYPAGDTLSVTLNGQNYRGKIADVFRSEAGMATLFDRKVNTGNLSAVPAAITQVMAAHNLTKLSDAAAFERELVQSLKFRADFLADKNLMQPQ